jgi:hypothetical protein
MTANLTINGTSTKCFNIELHGVDTRDYPDFCDAYVVSASKLNAAGEEVELSREELESIPFEEVQELAWDKFF